jgi:sulfite exporter TauE/SafE
MALFGLGTFPAMFALKISSEIISTSLRLQMRKWVPIMTLLIGVLFVVRGLGLGIPYLSPEFVKEKNEKGELIEKAECCSKPSSKNENTEEKSCCKKDKPCH